jgi:hypothetical protein
MQNDRTVQQKKGERERAQKKKDTDIEKRKKKEGYRKQRMIILINRPINTYRAGKPPLKRSRLYGGRGRGRGWGEGGEKRCLYMTISVRSRD